MSIDMDAAKTLKIFQQIAEEDIILFNMDSNVCKPEDLIFTSIPVPPNCIRPTVLQGDRKNEDDLTAKICKILKRN